MRDESSVIACVGDSLTAAHVGFRENSGDIIPVWPRPKRAQSSTGFTRFSVTFTNANAAG